ncbi:MAG: PEP-CTERM sorting domain-containing protein [Planctomycetota bacterium]
MLKRFSVTSLVLVGAFCATPLAAFAGDEGDIGLRFENNKIVTTIVGDGPNPFGGDEERVFEGILGDLEGEGEDTAIFSPLPTSVTSTSSFVTNVPGFDTAEELFSNGSRVGIDITTPTLITDSLMEFNGTGLVSTSVELQATFTIGSNTILTRTDGDTNQTDDSGILFLPAFSGAGGEQNEGRWHRHYVFALYSDILSNGNLVEPATGVYVLELDVVTEEPGISDSDPIFIVFGVNADPDDAIEFVEANVVPEPTSALALLAGAGLIATRRCRRA